MESELTTAEKYLKTLIWIVILLMEQLRSATQYSMDPYFFFSLKKLVGFIFNRKITISRDDVL